jgi:hypothetical protein
MKGVVKGVFVYYKSLERATKFGSKSNKYFSYILYLNCPNKQDDCEFK